MRMETVMCGASSNSLVMMKLMPQKNVESTSRIYVSVLLFLI